jgi:hypothetical protein
MVARSRKEMEDSSIILARDLGGKEGPSGQALVSSDARWVRPAILIDFIAFPGVKSFAVVGM